MHAATTCSLDSHVLSWAGGDRWWYYDGLRSGVVGSVGEVMVLDSTNVAQDHEVC